MDADESIPQWLKSILDSRSKEYVSVVEAGVGVVHYLATAEPFTSTLLREAEALPRVLPEEVWAVCLDSLERAIAREYEMKITTVGGHGRLGNPASLRATCAVLGLLGELERDRVKASFGIGPVLR